VFAEWPAGEPDAPTFLVYGHHDVQPVEPLALWQSPPFEPTVADGVIRGRGAADDKGQVLFHTLAVRAHLAATGRSAPAVTVKLLVEGEEESGSPHFVELLHAHRDRLHCDVVVVSDTGMWSRNIPSTVVGMRGLAHAEVHLRGPSGDIHSGSFGGAVRNPLTELCRLLARLHDEESRVTIPGFYDGVGPLSEQERELFARLPFDEAGWLRDARSSAVHGEAGYSTLERVWARPTAELNGIWGGYTGPGAKTIVPSEAHAKVSFRLVAGQEPARVLASFRDWVLAAVPPGVEARVDLAGNAVRPCLTPLDAPALTAVRVALARAFDAAEVLVTREGGSGPEADLQDVLGAPVVFLGASLPDDGWHAPNEKVDVPMLLKGAEAAAYLWEQLPATLGRA
ncbi:MAG: M20/M25/M40 family metallo-hydrolase, partial [Actinomycetota bacterium]|nr:M20/M25/M40 family metallo-hydrolase [Actinomycetota bacterium]